MRCSKEGVVEVGDGRVLSWKLWTPGEVGPLTRFDEKAEESEEEFDSEMARLKIEEEDIAVLDQGTRRLAVVNMDWTLVTAADLYVLLSSFLPKEGGKLLSVSVYPTLNRLKEEEQARQGGSPASDEESIIRRHYFAVAECDSISTADHVYLSCNGLQLEMFTMHLLDLRFIPDDMEFNHPPRDTSVQKPADYEGLQGRLCRVNNNACTEHRSIPPFREPLGRSYSSLPTHKAEAMLIEGMKLQSASSQAAVMSIARGEDD